MVQFLAGKKTHIVAGATVLYAILGVALGYVDQDTAIQLIATALGFSALRAGVAGK